MKVIIKGEIVDMEVLLINNGQNEIMITEGVDGSFIITQSIEEGEELLVSHINKRSSQTSSK